MIEKKIKNKNPEDPSLFAIKGVSGISGCSFSHALLTIAEIRPDKLCMYQPSLYLTLSGKSNTSNPP